jgi:hypothetical protein
MSDEVSVTITRQDKYRFLVDFGPDIAKMAADEPAPLGDGAGPSPSQLLAARREERAFAHPTGCVDFIEICPDLRRASWAAHAIG